MSGRQIAVGVLGGGCATGLLPALGCMALLALGDAGAWLAVAAIVAGLARGWRALSVGGGDR